MPDLPALAACAFGRWSPGIGDPLAVGWLAVAAYLLAALLASRVLGRAERLGLAPRERVFWALVLLAMLALGVNKELDLQTALTAFGRCAAKLGGWYDSRRPAQLAFILAMAVGGAATLAALARLLRGTLARNGVALLGLTLLGVFVMIRAGSFHHVDALIGRSLGGWRIHEMLELGGIALVAFGALRAGTGGAGSRLRRDREA